MFCPRCRNELNKNFETCPSCGAELGNGSAESSRDVPFFVQTPNEHQYAYGNEQSFRPGRTFDDESIRRFLIGFTIVSVVVIAIVTYLVLM
jgi:uncharacterized membrane protein YvbJ